MFIMTDNKEKFAEYEVYKIKDEEKVVLRAGVKYWSVLGEVFDHKIYRFFDSRVEADLFIEEHAKDIKWDMVG